MTAAKLRARRANFAAPNLYSTVIVAFLYFITVLAARHTVAAFCHPGCKCVDESKAVECENITAIPILFHPMLRSLTVRNSPALRLDPVSIGLYQELETLDLSANNIREIPDGFFGALKKLRELRLRANKLKVFEPKSFGLTQRHAHIQNLDLSDNELERIVSPSAAKFDALAAIGHWPALLSLNLSGNQLHSLEARQFAWARNLRELDLSRNRIARLTADIFNATSALEELNLAANIISELPAQIFSSQRKLAHLNLARNLISNIDANAFAQLSALKSLDFASNLISSVEEGRGLAANWHNLRALTSLTLSSNALVEIPRFAFDGLDALARLQMRQMPRLKRIQENAFAGLISLESFALSGCPLLTALPAKLFGDANSASDESINASAEKSARRVALPPTRLTRLDLSANALTRLDASILDDSNWRSLAHLNLAGNRWNCDCALLAFLPRLLRQAADRANDDNATDAVAYCNQPEALFNARIESIKSPPKNCETTTRQAAPLIALLTVAAAALATLTTMMAVTALICCCCWRYHYGSQSANRAAGAQKARSYRHHHKSFERVSGEKNGKGQFFRRFALPLINGNASKKVPDSNKKCVVSAATASTASTASSNSSSTSSYCNRDACAPLYNGGATSLSESLYYDRAATAAALSYDAQNSQSHCQLTARSGNYSNPPNLATVESGTTLPYGAANTAYDGSGNLKNGMESSSNEYYSCIPPSADTNTVPVTCRSAANMDYYLPPPSGYYTTEHPCHTFQRGYRPYPQLQRVPNSNSQVLISYGAENIAYPPYLYHSKSNYGGLHHYGNNVPCNSIGGDDSGCFCNYNNSGSAGATVDLLDAGANNDAPTTVVDAHTIARLQRPPSFVAPPPPSTIPPPPGTVAVRLGSPPNTYRHHQQQRSSATIVNGAATVKTPSAKSDVL